MTIILHHLERSRSLRVLWLLKELDLPHVIRRYKRDPVTRLAPAELKQVHPLGKAPVITVDGLCIAESGAIAEFLVDRAGGQLGAPAVPGERLLYRQFLHYAEGSLMPALLNILVLRQLGEAGAPAMPQRQAMLDNHLDWLENELSVRDWFAGREFTAADVLMSFPLEVSTQIGGLDAARPGLWNWLHRIHARPAYQAASAEAAD
ncbi:glutathione S-transferase family protein [Pseudoroseomonas globiformis]|uniref:Glutathione S-transferase family protein n=1 Tax=Teichococcus globiformis TaxID=2307229 RepID=A0ABV7FZ75_9PROT